MSASDYIPLVDRDSKIIAYVKAEVFSSVSTIEVLESCYVFLYMEGPPRYVDQTLRLQRMSSNDASAVPVGPTITVKDLVESDKDPLSLRQIVAEMPWEAIKKQGPNIVLSGLSFPREQLS